MYNIFYIKTVEVNNYVYAETDTDMVSITKHFVQKKKKRNVFY